MMQLLARIRLKTPRDGSIGRDATSGMALEFASIAELVPCNINGVNGQTTFLRGTDYEVHINLPDGTVYADMIEPGMMFDVHFGSSVMGQGEVLEIIED